MLVSITTGFILIVFGDGFATEWTSGTCGPALAYDVVTICMVTPLSIALCCFAVYTPLNVYHLRKHMAHMADTMAGAQLVDKHLVNLYQRLIVYTLIMAAAIIIILFVTIDSHVHWNNGTLIRVTVEYVECLVTNFQILFDAETQRQIIENGDIIQRLDHLCTADPDHEMPAADWYGILIMASCSLIAAASFAFSCSLKKCEQWKTGISWILHCGKRREKELNDVEMPSMEPVKSISVTPGTTTLREEKKYKE